MLKEGQDKNYALSSKYLIELIDKPILDTKQICNKKIIKDLQHETFVINKNRFEEELDNTLRSFSSEKEKVMWKIRNSNSLNLHTFSYTLVLHIIRVSFQCRLNLLQHQSYQLLLVTSIFLCSKTRQLVKSMWHYQKD